MHGSVVLSVVLSALFAAPPAMSTAPAPAERQVVSTVSELPDWHAPDMAVVVDHAPEAPPAAEYFFSNGFLDLANAEPATIGAPVSPEVPGDETGSVVQRTSTGLVYWRGPGSSPVWTDGHRRLALVGSRGMVRWEGPSLDPPREEPIAEKPERSTPTASGSVVGTMRAHVTWYAATGNRMRNNQWPYPGAAACGSSIGYGSTVIFDTGEQYTCADTGLLGANQVDVFGDRSAPGRLDGHTLRVIR